MLKTDLEILLKVQEFDNKIDEINASKADIPEQLNGQKAALKAAQDNLADVKKGSDDVSKSKKMQELELAAKQAEVKKLQEQQYAVKDNNSFAAIRHEIQTRGEEAAKIEEGIITAMVEEDAAKARIAAAQAAVKVEEEKLKVLQVKCVEDEKKLDVDIEVVRKQREEEFAKIGDGELKARYDQVRESTGGQGIAKIESNSCAGCNMSLRAQEVIEIRKFEKIITCETCGRILYG